MKKIYIGRGSDCHIRIKDDTDKVSRRQAVIEVSPLGKMRIHDTSTNGTFVNGKKVEKPAGTPVKRGDKVDFAHVSQLDWTLVKDPYRMMKLAVAVFVIVLLGLAAYFFIFSDALTQKEAKDDADATEEVYDADSASADSAIADEAAPAAAPAATRPANRPRSTARPKAPAGQPGTKNNSDPNKNGINNLLNDKDVNNAPDPQGLRPDNNRSLTPDGKREGRLSREKY